MATDSFLNRELRPHFRQHPPPLPHRNRLRKLRLEHRPRMRPHARACGRIVAQPLDSIRQRHRIIRRHRHAALAARGIASGKCAISAVGDPFRTKRTTCGAKHATRAAMREPSTTFASAARSD